MIFFPVNRRCLIHTTIIDSNIVLSNRCNAGQVFLEISKFFPILALIVASAAAQVNADESPPPVGISLWQKICAPTKGVLLNLSGAIFSSMNVPHVVRI